MDKIRAWVIANATSTKIDSRVANVADGQVGKTDIDCLASEVQAVSCDATRRAPKHRVGCLRTVSAQDIKTGVRISQVGFDIVQQVEKLGIHREGLAGAEIPEEVVQLLERAPLVAVADSIDNAETIFRMQMMK
jgi:hypothetical protein